jgi:hypothetical protein
MLDEMPATVILHIVMIIFAIQQDLVFTILATQLKHRS